MTEVIWTRGALANVQKTWDYLEQFNLQAAIRVTSALRDAANSLADHPNRGRPVPNSTQRELVAVFPYIIRYRVRSGRVTILRIRHAARQPAP